MPHKAIKHFDTLCAKPVKEKRTTAPHQLPLYLSSAFQFQDAAEGIDAFLHQPDIHVYTRYGNPTIDAVAQRLADLETYGTDKTGYAVMTSSGMAAINVAIQSLVEPGDAILTQGNLYGGTTELFKTVFGKNKIQYQLHDFNDLDDLKKILQSNAYIKVIYLETPTNPTLSCIDIKAICDIAHQQNILVVVDNTFCTPYLQRPISLGADIVIHSTTKFLHGHGVSTAGVIITSDRHLFLNKIWNTLKLLGSTCNPFDAWLVQLGLKTLPIRMKKQSDNAMALAIFLEQQNQIKKVYYPGLASHKSHSIAKKQMQVFGAMLSFEVQGDLEMAKRCMDKLHEFANAPSLGETDTMILHPVSSSHLKVDPQVRQRLGITDTLIRLSVGLEDVEEMKHILSEALQ